MKLDLSLTPSENCPSFEICQFNDCPLEAKPNNYKIDSADKLLYNFHKCRCGKKKRMEIANAYNMKSLGLTLKELDNLKKSLKMKSLMFSTQRNELKIEKKANSGEGFA